MNQCYGATHQIGDLLVVQRSDYYAIFITVKSLRRWLLVNNPASYIICGPWKSKVKSSPHPNKCNTRTNLIFF